MIIPYGYIARGFKPQRVLGLGVVVRTLERFVVIYPGPFRSVAGQAWTAGSDHGQTWEAGSTTGQNFTPGSEQGQST
jgi:hypothetical protein